MGRPIMASAHDHALDLGSCVLLLGQGVDECAVGEGVIRPVGCQPRFPGAPDPLRSASPVVQLLRLTVHGRQMSV